MPRADLSNESSNPDDPMDEFDLRGLGETARRLGLHPATRPRFVIVVDLSIGDLDVVVIHREAI